MSKKEDFHPSLSTLDIAKFQLMENGFAGVTNGVTLVPAKNVKGIEANKIHEEVHGFLHDIELLASRYSGRNLSSMHEEIGPLEKKAVELLVKVEEFLRAYPENPACAAIVVYKPSIQEGTFNVQPVGMIVDPWEVTEPEFYHTDGAGNVKTDEGQTGVAGNNTEH